MATLLAWAPAVVLGDNPVALVTVTLAVAVALRLETGAARLFAVPDVLRGNAVALVEDAFARIVAAHPAVRRITIEYPIVEARDEVLRNVAKVEVHGEVVSSGVREEIVRALWLSRLYPLRRAWIWDGTATTVELTGAEAHRLRHRYGPRPYGPRET